MEAAKILPAFNEYYEDYDEPSCEEPLFVNPFQIKDLLVFDDEAWENLLNSTDFEFQTGELGLSMHNAPQVLIHRIAKHLPEIRRGEFQLILKQVATDNEIQSAQQIILDKLFWELVYWKTPELYEELTEGEAIHPGIFKNLAHELKNKTVLDVGAGSGRASFECLRHGAKRVHAIEPSKGLLRILLHKLSSHKNDPNNSGEIIAQAGRFNNLPLGDNSVDISLACSAFTAEAEQGGEAGLNELRRVTRPGGKIVIIWPRPQDIAWLTERGFQYASLPVKEEMKISFRSVSSAWRCANLFYQKNKAVRQYLLKHEKPEIPFSVLGVNPPRDYCWLKI